MVDKDLENLKEIIKLCKYEIEHDDKNINAVLDLEDLKSLNNLINEYEKLLQKKSKIVKYFSNEKMKKRAIKSLEEFAYTKYGTFSVREAQIILSLIRENQEELK